MIDALPIWNNILLQYSVVRNVHWSAVGAPSMLQSDGCLKSR